MGEQHDDQRFGCDSKVKATAPQIVNVPSPYKETKKLALHVVSSVTCGRRFDWEQSDKLPPGHQMTLVESLSSLVENISILALFPRWMLNLPIKRLRITQMAYREFGAYIREFIDAEKNHDSSKDLKSVLNVLVSKLTDSTEQVKENGTLSYDEVLGNVFFTLLAGHETTYSNHIYIMLNGSANVLTFAMTHLALHPNVQERLYQEIRSVCGDRLPLFTDLPNLVYALCIMYETMRLHPATGSFNMRVVSNYDDKLLEKYPVTKDFCIAIDAYNINRHEKYWGENANEFDPSRFDNRSVNIKNSDREDWYSSDGKTKVPVRGAFFGFSDGPRICLGISFIIEH